MRTLDEINLSEQDRQAVSRAAALLRQQFPVEQVVLFGSKARGDDQEVSDIDLLVLTRHELSWPERDKITSALYGLQLEMGVLLSTLVVSAKEWNEGLYQVMPIRDEIDRDGVIA